MGREAFVALTPAQRAILGRAGREAIAPELRQIERDEAAAVSEMCRRGGPFLVTASSAELAALRRTVQPVYHELERDSETLIAAGIAPKDAAAFRGHHTAEFAVGSFTFQGDPGSGNSATGTNTDGDIIRLVFETGIALQLGRPYELSWNVYRARSPSRPLRAGSPSSRSSPSRTPAFVELESPTRPHVSGISATT